MTDKALTDIAFSNFDITPALLDGLEQAGFSRCTPIQGHTLLRKGSTRDAVSESDEEMDARILVLGALDSDERSAT